MTPLIHLTPAEADQLIIRARRSLASHAREMRVSQAPADLMAAIDANIDMLRELAAAHPGKREKIEALIARYAP